MASGLSRMTGTSTFVSPGLAATEPIDRYDICCASALPARPNKIVKKTAANDAQLLFTETLLNGPQQGGQMDATEDGVASLKALQLERIDHR